MKKKAIFLLCLNGITAALYTGLCLLLQPISYGPVQVRFSEALTLLPALIPQTVPGLTLGCLLANLLGGNLYDIVFGTLATLLAALLTARLRGRDFLAAIPPVAVNALVIGAVLTWGYHLGSAWWINMLTVGAGEGVACFLLGVPLIKALRKQGMDKWSK